MITLVSTWWPIAVVVAVCLGCMFGAIALDHYLARIAVDPAHRTWNGCHCTYCKQVTAQLHALDVEAERRALLTEAYDWSDYDPLSGSLDRSPVELPPLARGWQPTVEPLWKR